MSKYKIDFLRKLENNSNKFAIFRFDIVEKQKIIQNLYEKIYYIYEYLFYLWENDCII